MTSYCTEDSTVLQRAAKELEGLRDVPKHDGISFPKGCRTLLYSIPGNMRCVDCGNMNPEWASVTYGVLLCVCCSGRHRSFGVSTSRVRSISMDAWSHEQVLAMLEGGNQQLQNFFDRHQMGNGSTASNQRYHTKAAKFYRTNLDLHTKRVGKAGLYKGRNASRRGASVSPERKPVPTERKSPTPLSSPKACGTNVVVYRRVESCQSILSQ